MQNISIIVGSQMGSAEYVAEQLQEVLEQHGLTSTLHEQPKLDEINDNFWLICTSTHGAGDFPDNIQVFVDDINKNKSLENIIYAVIGLGDSSYDLYNHAAHMIDQMIEKKGGKRVIDRLEIDAQSETLPEDIALAWLPEYINKLTN
jgi:MioC protein